MQRLRILIAFLLAGCEADISANRADVAFATAQQRRVCRIASGRTLEKDQPRFEQLFVVACNRSIRGATGKDDAFDAAVDIIECVSSGECIDDASRMRAASGGAPFRRDAVAVRWIMGLDLDWRGLARDVGTFDPFDANAHLLQGRPSYMEPWKPIDDENARDLRALFLDRAGASFDAIRGVVGRFTPQSRRTYAEPALHAWRMWREDRAAGATFAARATALSHRIDDALAGTAAVEDLVERARALRDEIAGACRDRGRKRLYCLGDPVVASLTQKIVLLAGKSRDAASLETEQRVLDETFERRTLRDSVVLAIRLSSPEP